jgi:hypothetical protein
LFAKVGDTLAVGGSLVQQGVRAFAGRVRRFPGGGATEDGALVFRASIADFYAALGEGRPPRASLEEGAAVVRSCLRAIAAARPALEQTEEAPWQLAIVSS